MPNTISLYQEASCIIKKIQSNPNYLSHDESMFHQTITDISHYINHKINSLENYQLLVAYPIYTILTLGFALLTEDSTEKAILLALLLPALATLGTKYVASPVADFMRHSFFHKKDSTEKTIVIDMGSQLLTDEKEKVLTTSKKHN